MEKKLSFEEITNRLQKEALEQITLRDIIEKSRKEFYDSLKVNEDDIYSISLVDKDGTVKGIRKFSSDDIVSDIKEYAKKVIRKNSDNIAIYTKKNGEELKDMNSKICDVIENKNEKLIIQEKEEK
jgi:hypothetical protein